MPLFMYLAEHPDLAQAYNGWMTRQSERQNLALLQGYDFSGFHHLVDVGAGQGSTLFSVLQALQR